MIKLSVGRFETENDAQVFFSFSGWPKGTNSLTKEGWEVYF